MALPPGCETPGGHATVLSAEIDGLFGNSAANAHLSRLPLGRIHIHRSQMQIAARWTKARK
jgi:hypothetical protein